MFDTPRQKVKQRFADLASLGALFQTNPDRDRIWQVYLDAIPEEFRQSNRCNCCRSFMRQFGGVVAVGSDNLIKTLWDFEVPDDPEYANAIPAVRQYVLSLPIVCPFTNPDPKLGTEENPDIKRGTIWTHYHAVAPSRFLKTEAAAGPFVSNAVADRHVFQRGLIEITPEAIRTTLELIGQNDLYRGAEFKSLLEGFAAIQARYLAVPEPHRLNWTWREAPMAGGAVTRLKNSAIGTLLIDISEGQKSLDASVAAFEAKVGSTAYKRPTTIATPRMIDVAKKRLGELGLLGSLSRRLLSERDLTVDNTLFVHRPTVRQKDVFAQLTDEAPVNPRSLGRIAEIPLDDFIRNVIPTTTSMRVLFENEHLGNLVSLVGPVDPDAPSLFKWSGNNVSWSYTGAVTDSTRERVKRAGGNVDGFIRVSLAWGNYDDLDLHIVEPGGHEIYYMNKGMRSPSGGILDVDMNAGIGTTREPVENVCWAGQPLKDGIYRVVVYQYAQREVAQTGFTVEFESAGQLHTFQRDANGLTNHRHEMFKFEYTKAGGLKVIGDGTAAAAKYRSQTKWGLKTGQFHQVRAITYSPNHWADKIGNKHVFFLLDRCVSDEPTRGFYNEFLRQDLDADRKTFEMLAGKVAVETVPAELSGLGFSDTIRSSVIVEVEGSLKRTLRVKL